MKVVSAWTMIMPVVFVLFVAFIRELLEEIGRRRADIQTNNQIYTVCNEQTQYKFKKIQSKQIKQGDIIKLNNLEEVPCDILLLQSSDSSKICYINTAQLDGEANLKQKGQFLNIQISEEELSQIKGNILTEPPSESLQFNGLLNIRQTQQHSIDGLISHNKFDISNILLRGMKIQNTDYCYGIVIYTSKQCKIMQSDSKARNKFSKLESRLRKILLWSCLIILALCFIFTGVSYNYYKDFSTESDYIVYQQEQDTTHLMLLNRFCSFLIIISYYAPISLIVSLDVTRYVQAFFISADKSLRIKELQVDLSKQENKYLLELPKIKNLASQQKFSQVRNSMAMETLPEINYIFSDKTGTMTKNKMKLKLTVDKSLNEANKIQDEELLESLAVCNTVFPRIINNKVQYQAESPDEVAFVQAAEEYEYIMKDRMKDYINYKYKEQKIQYKILAIIPFNSDRKRMSIICQNMNTDQTYIFCKGAEIKILPLLNCDKLKQNSYHQIVNKVAGQGLRTLVFSKRLLSEKEIQYVQRQYPEIKGLQPNHPNYVEFANQLEKELEFVGITGIEDELQDNIQQTFNVLRDAGISIFMLTGDQKETALSVAKTSSLIDESMKMIDLTSQKLQIVSQPRQTGISTDIMPILIEATQFQSQLVEDRDLYMQTLTNRVVKHKKNQKIQKSKTFLIIDSQMLVLLLPGLNEKKQSYNPYTQYFVQLILHAESIICCRLTPDQKARIVKILQQYQTNITTLAIGDGCNDVFMLKQADVSIGIAGLEGLSAANNSDISVVNFQSLRKLITVHGRYTHLRNQTLIDYSLWKNGLIVFPTLIYQFYCQFTAQMGVEGILLMMFNTLITMISMMVFCFVEKDVYEQDIQYSGKALKDFYSKKWSNYTTAIIDVIYALYNSLIIVFLTRAILVTQHIADEGYEADLYTFQSFNMTTAAFAGIAIVGQISKYWAWAVPVFILISVLVLLLTLLYGAFTNSMGIGQLGTFQNMYTNGTFTIYCCVAAILSLLPLFVIQMIKYFLKPQTSDLLNLKEVQNENFDFTLIQQQQLEIVIEKDYLLKLIQDIFKYIEEQIVNANEDSSAFQGIYRLQGNQNIINETIDCIKQQVEIDVTQYKIHDIANIGKQLLQNQLQEYNDLKLIKILYYQKVQKIIDEQQFKTLTKQILEKQEEIDIKILKLVQNHIKILEEQQNKTKMQRNSLLLMFQPCILGNQDAADIAAEFDVELFDLILQVLQDMQ